MSSKIVRFAHEVLGVKLYPKQEEIISAIWSDPSKQSWVWALGRRSGKTLMAAIICIYTAVVNSDDYIANLRRGESFYIFIVANKEEQAKIALKMVSQLLNESPIMKALITKETTTEIQLLTGAIIRALPASARVNRGYPTALLIFDELAHSQETGGDADGKQIDQALDPGMAQFGKKAKKIMLSSPWLDSGFFYEEYEKAKAGSFGYGYFNAPTWVMNPTIDPDYLKMKEDANPEAYRREFGADFTGAVNQFLRSELIDDATEDRNTPEPVNRKYKGKYFLSLDPASGGVGRDDYVACITHYEDGLLVVDEWFEFSPNYINGKKKEVDIDEVEQWIKDRHKVYNFAKVVLDQHQSKGTIQRLQKTTVGRRIEELVWTEGRKMEAFSKMRELFVSGDISIYNDPKAIKQLKNLTIIHKQNGNFTVTGGTSAAVDDYCSALAGCVLIAKPVEVYHGRGDGNGSQNTIFSAYNDAPPTTGRERLKMR